MLHYFMMNKVQTATQRNEKLKDRGGGGEKKSFSAKRRQIKSYKFTDCLTNITF